MAIMMSGIPNCDTVKKARTRLADGGIDHVFHDYKKAGVDPARLDAWIARVGWEPLLNRAGTTFRKLPDADREGIDRAKARALMLAHPSLIRRPVLEHGDVLLIGLKPAEWDAAGL